MPILGKDYQIVDGKQVFVKPKEDERREIKLVEVTLVHPSKILPSRQTVREVVESVEKDGIQQPVVARPHPILEGKYEIIDGVNRVHGAMSSVPGLSRFAVGKKQEILVDIRYDVSDAEMFKLSKSFHTRGERNTYEQAEFYVKWIAAKAKELGKEEGALTEVAKELITEAPNSPLYSMLLNSKQSSLSQHCRVYEMFQKLEQKYPIEDFEALKSLGLNRLNALATALDDEPKLIEAARKLKKNPDTSKERIKEWTHRDHTTDSTTPEMAYIRLPPKETKDLKKSLYKLNSDTFENASSSNEILRVAVISLVRQFVTNFTDYEVDLERIPRKGIKFNGLFPKSKGYFRVDIGVDNYLGLANLMRAMKKGDSDDDLKAFAIECLMVKATELEARASEKKIEVKLIPKKPEK